MSRGEAQIRANLLASKPINLLLNLSELQCWQTIVNLGEPRGSFCDYLHLISLGKKKRFWKGTGIISPELNMYYTAHYYEHTGFVFEPCKSSWSGWTNSTNKLPKNKAAGPSVPSHMICQSTFCCCSPSLSDLFCPYNYTSHIQMPVY